MIDININTLDNLLNLNDDYDTNNLFNLLNNNSKIDLNIKNIENIFDFNDLNENLDLLDINSNLDFDSDIDLLTPKINKDSHNEELINNNNINVHNIDTRVINSNLEEITESSVNEKQELLSKKRKKIDKKKYDVYEYIFHDEENDYQSNSYMEDKSDENNINNIDSNDSDYDSDLNVIKNKNKNKKIIDSSFSKTKNRLPEYYDSTDKIVNKRSKFLTTLQNVCKNKKYKKIIDFYENSGIIIYDIESFKNSILYNEFKNIKLYSFYKMLNIHFFYRLNLKNNNNSFDVVYLNPLFTEEDNGNYDKINNLKLKNPKKNKINNNYFNLNDPLFLDKSMKDCLSKNKVKKYSECISNEFSKDIIINKNKIKKQKNKKKLKINNKRKNNDDNIFVKNKKICK